MRLWRDSILFVLLFAIVASVSGDEQAASRPRDPWVFRCVLDQRPRMVVIVLHEKLWVAYDATTCGLYKAWLGDVDLKGAVYTTEHGPQPTVRGEILLNGIDEANWVAYRSGSQVECTATWKGYRIVDDRVTLLYEIRSPKMGAIEIEEQVDVEVGEGGDQVRLLRTFRTKNVGDNCAVAVKVPLMNAKADGRRVHIMVDGREATSELASVEVLTVGLRSNEVTQMVTWLDVPATANDAKGENR